MQASTPPCKIRASDVLAISSCHEACHRGYMLHDKVSWSREKTKCLGAVTKCLGALTKCLRAVTKCLGVSWKCLGAVMKCLGFCNEVTLLYRQPSPEPTTTITHSIITHINIVVGTIAENNIILDWQGQQHIHHAGELRTLSVVSLLLLRRFLESPNALRQAQVFFLDFGTTWILTESLTLEESHTYIERVSNHGMTATYIMFSQWWILLWETSKHRWENGRKW